MCSSRLTNLIGLDNQTDPKNEGLSKLKVKKTDVNYEFDKCKTLVVIVSEKIR